MSTIQVIYTTSDKGQFVANLPLSAINLRTEKTAIESLKCVFYGRFCFAPDTWKEDFYNQALSSGKGVGKIPEIIGDTPDLVKISMCVTIPQGQKPPKCPKWYSESGGKIYFKQ